MTITNGYTTLAAFHAYKDITSLDGDDDALIEDLITRASRAIDNYTERWFYAKSETRYFTAQYYDLLEVDDLLTVTTLKTDEDGDRTYEVTWATTDYDLLPYNNAPYVQIGITPEGDNTFPMTRKGVEIAGTWGFSSSTPAAVEMACLIIARDFYFGRFGDAQGSSGVITPDGVRLIPGSFSKQAMDLLKPYRRMV